MIAPWGVAKLSTLPKVTIFPPLVPYFLSITHLFLYRFKYIKLLQAQSLTVFEITILGIFIPSKNFVNKIFSFQNVFHGYRQFANLLNLV